MAKSYSPEIVKAVEEFFTKEELNYIPCNENGVIRSGMMLSSDSQSRYLYGHPERRLQHDFCFSAACRRKSSSGNC